MKRNGAGLALGCTMGLAACNAMTLRLDDADRLVCTMRSGAFSTEIIASHLYDGIPTKQLEEKARSRDANGLAAARVMGERYENGRDAPRDLKKAAFWYRQAALVLPDVHYVYSPGYGNVSGTVIAVGASGSVTPGDPIAMRHLGEMYRRGGGIPPNDLRANALIACAAHFGVRDALRSDGSPI